MNKKGREIDTYLMNAYKIAKEKKAFNIVILDLREYFTITDYFLICSGASFRQAQAICDGIVESMSHKGIVFQGIEGYNNGRWILIDYGDFVIHIFQEEWRAFYDLERLWGDAQYLAGGE